MGNNSNKPLSIYIDTNALRGMSFNKEVACLLNASKLGKIRLYISESILWERGRQQYELDTKYDRVIPYTSEINKYLTWFKVLFENHGVIIIKSDENILDKVRAYIEDSNTYFNENKSDDQRDAHILASAELKLEKNTLILCNDINLKKEFNNIGFNNIECDFKNFIQKLMGTDITIPKLDKPNLGSLDEYQISTTFTPSFQEFINNSDHRFNEYLITLPTITDKLNAKLGNMQLLDTEIRRRILGYIGWFSQINKTDLYAFLKPMRYEKNQINSNAQRLAQEGLLIETDSYWLEGIATKEAKEISKQAMAVVMPEILELMELS